MDKSLRDKAIDLKGKKYVLVADRVNFFNDTYPNGCIQTEQLESTDRVEFKAIIIPDADKPTRFFTGHSQAVWGDGFVNKTSALENAETSAVGRALALMGIGVIDSIASVDEINKAKSTPERMEKIGFCNVCGEQGIKAKLTNGTIFTTCPNWKTHKDNNEPFKLVQPSNLTKEELEFQKSLDSI